MNTAHVHLIINHLPVIGILLSSLVLAFAMISNRHELKYASLWLVLLTSLSTIPAFLTGEGAEEFVEHLPGIQEKYIEDHEDFAKISLVISQLCGLLALTSIVALRRSMKLYQMGCIITLILSMTSLATLGIVANSGGKIRRPELQKKSLIESSIEIHE